MKTPTETPNKPPEVLPFFWYDWSGKNQFCCDGRCMSGPKEGNAAVFTVHLAFIVCVTLFCVFEVPFYYKHFSIGIIIPPFLLLPCTYICLLACQFMDPERSPFWSKPDDPNMVKSEPPVVELYTYRWCSTCCIWRLPKASHCRVCDNCVQGFDHHCLFVNNCIGIRNIKYFVGFLFITSILCLYGVAISFHYIVWNILTDEVMYENAIEYFPMLCVALVLTLIGVALIWFFLQKSLLFGLPASAGTILLFTYIWLCIGFNSIYQSPIPLILGLACLSYGSWVMTLSAIYVDYLTLGITKKESVALMRKNCPMPARSLGRILWFFLSETPASQLQPSS